MTTKHENQETPRICYYCGGQLEDRITIISEVVDNKVVVVKNVPAEVCTNCGEPYLTTEIADAVNALVRDAVSKNIELTVLNLTASGVVGAGTV